MGISKHDKQALADLFINMGVPLVTAMQTVESWSGGDVEPLAKKAETLAKLLNISVKFATNLTKKLEIRDAYTLENVRGRIIRIVTPIIAENYVAGGETPTEDSLSDLADLFDVLLSFADSVSPTDEKGSKPQKIAIMIEACEPVVSLIRENDLGLGAEKAFNQIIDGLKTRAEQLAPTLGIDNAIESGLFKSVIAIFTSCYRMAIEQNMDGDDAIKFIWNECDERLVIIQGLTGFVADRVGISVDKPKQKTVSAISKEEKPKAKKSDEDKNNDDEEDEDGDFNPMSFFSSGG